MNNDIISFIFDMKENEGCFQDYKSSEHKILLNIQQEKSNLLYDYINVNTDKGTRDNLTSLIESYIESICDTIIMNSKFIIKLDLKMELIY